MDKVILALGAVVLLSACTPTRPVGDFGRATPGWTHDTAMPAVGNLSAQYLRQEPVSNFNKTDQEEEMHNRVWRFLVAAHAKDWLYDMSVELQRTRIVQPDRDMRFTIERYYNWLKAADYNSSRTRYSTVGRHVAADIDTLPGTFKAICAVIEVDHQRQVAYAGLRTGLPPQVQENMNARKAENGAFIAWFVRALNYRYSSYSYALDRLLVETPHEQSMGVDDSLRRMKGFVDRANANDFCANQAGQPGWGGVVIPSRYQHSGDTEIVLPK